MKFHKIIAIILIVITALISLIVPAKAANIQIGDVNGDGHITISDATLIQKYLSGMKSSEKFYSQYADFDRSGKIGDHLSPLPGYLYLE